jgi:hypothetical protein
VVSQERPVGFGGSEKIAGVVLSERLCPGGGGEAPVARCVVQFYQTAHDTGG